MSEHSGEDVHKFLEQLQHRYGLSDEDVRDMIEDWKWINKSRRRASDLGTTAAKAFIWIFVSALFTAFLLGFKRYLGVE